MQKTVTIAVLARLIQLLDCVYIDEQHPILDMIEPIDCRQPSQLERFVLQQ